MAQDYAGLLTGLDKRPPNPMAGMDREGRMAYRAQGFADTMGRGFLTALGQDARNPQEKAMDTLGSLKLDTNDKVEQEKNIRQVAAVDRARAAKLAQMYKAQNAEMAQKQGLIDTANELGLENTVQLLQSGGSVEDAAKSIYEEQERQTINKGGRKGKLAVAENKNASPKLIAQIKNGQFDEMSDELFLEQVKGKKATLKAFTAQDGTLQSRRVDESANVYNEATGKWESPVTLGLTPAPIVSKVFNQSSAIKDALTDTLVDNFGELHTLAKDARTILVNNVESQAALEKGIFSDFAAPALLDFARIGKAMGIVPQSVEDTLQATQIFMITRAKMVLPLIKALGSGSGISDTDRKFIAKITAAEEAGIALDEKTIRDIIRIENEVADEYIDRSNGALDTLNGLPNSGLNNGIYDSLYVTKPEPFVPAPAVVNDTPPVAPTYSPATLEYLQSKGLMPR
jgi:hypothetical protein